MEILKRDQIDDPNDTFPRSEIVQQLSVLASALEKVPPGVGNYSTCIMGLNAIRRVLDRLLAKPRRPTVPQNGFDFLDNANFGAHISNDADFLQWLGNVDFDSNAWLDPSPAVYYSECTDMLIQTETTGAV